MVLEAKFTVLEQLQRTHDCMYVHREKGKENKKVKEQRKELSPSSSFDNMKLDNTIFCRLM